MSIVNDLEDLSLREMFDRVPGLTEPQLKEWVTRLANRAHELAGDARHAMAGVLAQEDDWLDDLQELDRAMWKLSWELDKLCFSIPEAWEGEPAGD
jgi:hypothetical protein